METASQPWLRRFAALLALAAGAVHLGQVGVHLEEGWQIAGFFVVVGVIQVFAAVLLLRPRPRSWFWFGIAGSAIIIGIWAVSRTLGLPFVEEGEVEALGVADAYASLAEGWTIVVLGLYLAEPIATARRWVYGLASWSVLGLAGLWLGVAQAGAFNQDPARLAAFQPSLIDWLVAAAATALAGGLLLAGAAPLRAPSVRGLAKGLIVATGGVATALFWLTLPPTIGQNLDCRWAPVSTVLPGGHQLEPDPILVHAGESRIVPVLELRVCDDDQDVALDGIEPLTVVGDGATLDGFWLLPGGSDLGESGLATLPSGAMAVPPGDRISSGEPRLLVARLVGTGEGDYILGAVRLHYDAEEANSVAFGTSVTVCSGHCREST